MVEPDGGRFTYGYDPAGQIERLVNPFDERTTFGYDDAGRRTVQRLGNGTRASYTYDAGDNLTLLANLKSDGSTISSFDYGYDPVGNRIRVIEAGGDRTTWSYDAADQLRAERRSGAISYAHSFSYDPVGGRTVKNEDGARTTYAYDSANQLTTSVDGSGTSTYSFDANENQRLLEAPDGSRTTTSWDFENQPALYELPHGARLTMAYNADEERVAKATDDVECRFVWDGQNYLLELDETGARRAIYTSEPLTYGRLISERRNDASRWHHFDVLGSTQELSGLSQSVVDTFLYTVWGEELARTGDTPTPFRWVGLLGYYWDEGIDRFFIRRRMYVASIGRWTSMDPLWLLPHTPVISHLSGPYQYSQNNPFSRVDPSGLIDIAGGGGGNIDLACVHECEDDCLQRFPRWYQWHLRAGCIAGCRPGCRNLQFTLGSYMRDWSPCQRDLMHCACLYTEWVATAAPFMGPMRPAVAATIAECLCAGLHYQDVQSRRGPAAGPEVGWLLGVGVMDCLVDLAHHGMHQIPGINKAGLLWDLLLHFQEQIALMMNHDHTSYCSCWHALGPKCRGEFMNVFR